MKKAVVIIVVAVVVFALIAGGERLDVPHYALVAGVVGWLGSRLATLASRR